MALARAAGPRVQKIIRQLRKDRDPPSIYTGCHDQKIDRYPPELGGEVGRHAMSERGRSALAKVAAASFAALVVALIVYVPIGRAYAGARVFTAEENAPIALTAPAGQRVVVQVKAHGTINGRWASETGIQLMLPGREPVLLVKPRKQDWNNKLATSIGHGESFEDVVIGGTFTVPSGTVNGTLEGSITYPSRRGFSNSFENETDKLVNPVTVTVVPNGQQSWVASGSALKMMIGLAIGLTMVIIGCTVTILVRKVRSVGSVSVARILGGLFSILLLAGLTLVGGSALQTFALSTPGASSGGGLRAPLPLLSFWYLPSLLSVVVAVGIATLLLSEPAAPQPASR